MNRAVQNAMNSPKRAHAGRFRLAVTVVILGLAILASLVLWRWRGPPVPEQAPQTVAADFLEELRTNRVDAAWAGTTAEFKSYLGRERLRDLVRLKPVLKEPLESSGVEEKDVNGIPLTVCTFSGPQKPGVVRVLLATEGGQLKVERLLVE